MMKTQLSLLLLVSMAGAMHPPSQKTSRLPLQKKEILLESPKNYAQRFLGVDPNTGKEVYYDPKPEVVLLDAKSGKYGLRWIGYDRKQKTIIYYRPDGFDAIVAASATRHSSREYLYAYTVYNSASSSQNVFGFVVQNSAADVRPLRVAGVYVGHMSRNGEMREGNWLDFAVLGMTPGIAPGRSAEHKLVSSAPPGLVECRAVGITGMKGVGEEPPQELENVLPGYEAWPSGYTIGPVDRLKKFSPSRYAAYIRERLAQFQQFGWATIDSAGWYEQNLRGDNLEAVYRRAEQDLKAGKITTEIYGLISAIRR